MLTNNNIRIFSALLFSMLVHAVLVASEFGARQHPVAGVIRQKVRVQLVARRIPAPKKATVVERLAQKIEKESPLPLSPPVEVAVKEIPSVKVPAVEQSPDPLEEITGSSAERTLPEVTMAIPLYRENPPPEYPALARRRHLEGTVVLEVSVTGNGRVRRLAVHESSGHRILDKAAERAVRKWLFEPGRRGIVPVAMEVLVPVRFSLR